MSVAVLAQAILAQAAAQYHTIRFPIAIATFSEVVHSRGSELKCAAVTSFVSNYTLNCPTCVWGFQNHPNPDTSNQPNARLQDYRRNQNGRGIDSRWRGWTPPYSHYKKRFIEEIQPLARSCSSIQLLVVMLGLSNCHWSAQLQQKLVS